MQPNFHIEILPQKHIAYLDTIGATQNEPSMHQLLNWAQQHKVTIEDAELITVYKNYHEVSKDPEAAMDSMQLMSCITIDPSHIINEHIKDTQIKISTIAEGEWAVGRFEVVQYSPEIITAWKSFAEWFHAQGYQQADRYPMEIYRTPLDQNKRYQLDLFLPVG